MAYIRTIKASFFTSDDIVSLSPLARLLYIALWTEADREGRMEWRPGNFKLRFLPGDNCDIRALCDELLESGLVVPYVVEGKTFAEIPTFKRHQSINAKERKSVLPERVTHATATRNDAMPTRDNGLERFGAIPLGKERNTGGKASTPPSQVAEVSTTECTRPVGSAQKISNGGGDDF